jgi:regulator of protease activity HflC (stomatin/prohibitin superfamily)
MNALITLFFFVYLSTGLRITSSKRSRLIERLGKFNREMQPGLSYLLPGVERVVSHESLKERVLDIPSQQCITKDNVSIEVDAVVYWQLLKHEQGYYAVENLSTAMVNLVLTQIRTEMGKLDLDQTFTTRTEVNEVLLKELDEATDPWGVKVKRVEMRDIIPSKGVKEAMEAQMTAEREKRAEILRSEGNKEAVLNNARAQAESLVLDAKAKQEAVVLAADADAKKQQMLANANAEAALSIAKAIGENKYTEEALRLLLAKDWMKMGEEMAHAKAGSVLMVDPQSPASLVAALKQFQQADKSETDLS